MVIFAMSHLHDGQCLDTGEENINNRHPVSLISTANSSSPLSSPMHHLSVLYLLQSSHSLWFLLQPQIQTSQFQVHRRHIQRVGWVMHTAERKQCKSCTVDWSVCCLSALQVNFTCTAEQSSLRSSSLHPSPACRDRRPWPDTSYAACRRWCLQI